jgi:hypothetical protein
MLSPVDSYSPPSKHTPGYLFDQPPSPSPSLLSVGSTSLPPLQGDDPPQKLQRPILFIKHITKAIVQFSMVNAKLIIKFNLTIATLTTLTTLTYAARFGS